MNPEINRLRANLGLPPLGGGARDEFNALADERDKAALAAAFASANEPDEITDVNIRVDARPIYQYALERERAHHAQTRLDCDAESTRAELHADNAHHLRVEVRELTEECRALETQRNVVLVLAFIGMVLAAALTAVML